MIIAETLSGFGVLMLYDASDVAANWSSKWQKLHASVWTFVSGFRVVWLRL